MLHEERERERDSERNLEREKAIIDRARQTQARFGEVEKVNRETELDMEKVNRETELDSFRLIHKHDDQHLKVQELNRPPDSILPNKKCVRPSVKLW